MEDTRKDEKGKDRQKESLTVRKRDLKMMTQGRRRSAKEEKKEPAKQNFKILVANLVSDTLAENDKFEFCLSLL